MVVGQVKTGLNFGYREWLILPIKLEYHRMLVLALIISLLLSRSTRELFCTIKYFGHTVSVVCLEFS